MVYLNGSHSPVNMILPRSVYISCSIKAGAVGFALYRCPFIIMFIMFIIMSWNLLLSHCLSLLPKIWYCRLHFILRFWKLKLCGAQALALCSMSRLTLGGKKRAGGKVYRDRRTDESDAVNSLLGKRYQTNNIWWLYRMKLNPGPEMLIQESLFRRRTLNPVWTGPVTKKVCLESIWALKVR